MSNNQVLAELFRQDQEDRKKNQNQKKWLKWVSSRDNKRRNKLLVFLKAKELKTAKDFYNAAMIFQHGSRREHISRAKSLSKKAINLGNKRARWLYAAATDRLLVMSGKKQKFGTQYALKRKSKGQNYYELLPVSKNTSDRERLKYGIKPLHNIKEKGIISVDQ